MPPKCIKVPRTCPTCGASYEIEPNVFKRGHGLYCSRACYVASRQDLPRIDRICRTCGVAFRVHPCTLQEGAYFCSRPCYLSRDLEPFADRFWRYVEKTETCWNWTGPNFHGYGTISRGSRKDGRVRAPRAAWELLVGPIPDGLYVCHKCDNPPCVRADPDPTKSHLFLGTAADNNRDRMLKGRSRKAAGQRLDH